MELDKIKYYRFKKDEKEDILRRLKEYFEREERIKLAYIFGGFTRRNVVKMWLYMRFLHFHSASS